MDSEDVYHIDFTTASTLEVFIARIEEIFVDWGLPRIASESLLGKGDYSKGTWLSQTETVCLVDPEAVWERDIELRLTRYALDCTSNSGVEEVSKSEDGVNQMIHDTLSSENDFCRVCLPPAPGPHPLSRYERRLTSVYMLRGATLFILSSLSVPCSYQFRWYGLRDFVVLVPQNAQDVDSESKVKTLFSCLHIAVDNTECGLPVFLQAGAPWQLYFLGLCRSPKLQTDFEMVHLERTPSHCKYLTGLLSLFKSKIGSCVYTGPVTVAVRFTYLQKEWPSGTWMPEGVDAEALGGEWLSFTEIGQLPFGSRFESIAEVTVSAIWPRLLEQSVVDGETYSDLEPLQAPVWRATVLPVQDLSCLLTDHFTEFLTLVQRESKIMAVSRALSGLRGVQGAQQDVGPISSDILMTLLYYLFPDADNNSASPVYSERLSLGGKTGVEEDDPLRKLAETRLKGLKSAPYDSLPWRLAVVMAHVVHSLGGLRSAEHLWNEFAQELVYRCEHNIPIPGLESGYPDPRSCLLYQKLQLLNCCISRRLEREKRAWRTTDDSDSEPDEFFDAAEDMADGKGKERMKVKHAPWDQPTGRLSRQGDLLLLETGEPLYVPRTQDPVPRTEDQLEEHADILLQLGTDAAGSALRASLMSASLLADMEAFKAANPGCVLADFIRWFSPRDWVEEEGLDEFGQPKGHLSSRMTLPGNTWKEVWEVAKPVPARCQRRLFDDTKEMEKALMFLEVQTPKDFATLLLPVVMSCVLLRLESEAADTPAPAVRDALDRLQKRSQTFSRMTTVIPKNFEELTKDILAIERQLLHFNAIYHRFKSESSDDLDEDLLKTFVYQLVIDEDILVPDGPRSPIGGILHKILCIATPDPKKADQVTADKLRNTSTTIPTPNEKEIILRVNTNKGPQRMYAVLKKNEFRLCGAFTNFDM